MTVAVFTFVLLLGNALKGILPFLISGQISLGTLGQSLAYLMPVVLVFALPMGLLTATLLVFGRLSAEQELIAMRASGVGLLPLILPLLVLSLGFSVLTAYINFELGPRCRMAYREMLYNLRMDLARVPLPEGRFIKEFDNYIFYVGKNGPQGELKDVVVFFLRNETNVEMTVSAPNGRLQIDETNNLVRLSLYNGKFVSFGESQGPLGAFEEYPLELPLPKLSRTPKVTDMTFTELRNELKQLDKLSAQPIVVRGLTPDQYKARKKEITRQLKDAASPVRFQLHRQASFSVACFGFTLIAIPLGIRMHRRETNVGIAVALVLVAVYYSFILTGEALSARPELVPHLIVWIPNFLFQAVGAVLLWRANRGV
jgi:lipopolysaccharide export system permease protein